ncbi:MAG: hypothetical protein BWY63_00704 [Chloroflexi bacterium ADurb.Bin360]|nr:MAG: hypothetical protein BWY63_00704 [Chloroflexi bacterium ADurb.Bin360]
MQRHRLDAASEIGQNRMIVDRYLSTSLPLYPSTIQGTPQRLDVLRTSTTAPPHRANTPCSKLRHCYRKCPWRQSIDRFAADVLRHPRIGHNTNRSSAECDQPSYRITHLLWTGRAINAHDIHRQCRKCRRYRYDIRSGQHPSTRIERNLRLQWHAQIQTPESTPNAVNRCLELEQILLRLKQQNIYPTLQQSLRGFSIHLDQHIKARLARDIFQREQPPRWSHRARHKARRVCLKRYPVSDTARQLCRTAIEVQCHFPHAKFR